MFNRRELIYLQDSCEIQVTATISLWKAVHYTDFLVTVSQENSCIDKT